jgi:flagellar biosynthesis protein FlhB
VSEPSPERIRRARARGAVAVSQRLSIATSVACALALVSVTVRATREAFSAGLHVATAAAATDATPRPVEALTRALSDVFSASAPTLAAATLGLALAHALQTRFLVTWPDDETPMLAPGEAIVSSLWALTLALTAALSAWALARDVGLAAHGVDALKRTLTTVLPGVAWRLSAVSLALGVGEFLWRRARYLDAMRPTRDEALRELREHEGDPAARRERQRRMRG